MNAMYKLVIADDEDRIRQGLEAVIDWNSLGFEVAATFADGSELLDFLSDNPDIDIILTDIQMSQVNGTEIAAAAKKLTPSPRVIFISAYKKLEYAFSAIENNVVDYIIKPIDFDKFTDTFKKLKQKLDDEAQTREIKANHMRYYKNISDTKEFFFSDLLTHPSNDSKTARSLFNILYPALSYDECVCSNVILSMPMYQDFLDNIWKLPVSDLDGSLREVIRLFTGNCEYWMTSKQKNTLVLSCICLSDVPDSTSQMLHSETEKLTETLETIFKTSFTILSIHEFRGIPDLAACLCLKEHRTAIEPVNTDIIEDVKKYIHEHIEEDLSLEILSDTFYLSQTYFSRLFKSKNGTTLIDFIINEKIEFAKQLLRSSNCKVYEVSEKLGYKSTSFFTRQFKKYTGMTPNEYRTSFMSK